MSSSHIQIRIKNESDTNNIFRLLRDLNDNEVVEDIEYWVD